MGDVQRLFDVGDFVPRLKQPRWRWLARGIERALRLDFINKVNADASRTNDPVSYLNNALETFRVRYHVEPEELLRIPQQGPVVVVANHPYGLLDAMVFMALLTGVRADAKVMANHLLLGIPQLKPSFIGVDPFGGPSAVRRNVQSMQRALSHLEAGGLLGVFPSGTVSHFHWRRMRVEDPAWSNHLFRLVQRSGASVVPFFFPGRNNLLFQLAGLIHPLLRTACIPRAAVRRGGSLVRATIGRPIPFSRLKRMDEAQRFTNFIRLQTYVLGGAGGSRAALSKNDGVPLAAPENPDVLAAEIAALPAEATVARDGEFIVALVRPGEAPALLREIGLLRELTFRGIGEGTGNERDVDEFDQHYIQLVLWDEKARMLAGGYRLGRVHKLFEKYGRKGIYSASLFRFKLGFFNRLGPALELGRSWIRPEYQRKRNGLALLWRGIAEYIVRHPECATLIGPVSISRDYQPLSRGLIVSFLKHTRLDRKLAAFVRPSRPYKMSGQTAQLARDVGDAVESIDDVSMFVSEIEADGKGVPLLFRHYLKFHSIVLSFNVDSAFSDVVDGLLLTDLRRTDPKLLRRFMTEEGWNSFSAFHGLGETIPAGRAMAPAIAREPEPAGSSVRGGRS